MVKLDDALLLLLPDAPPARAREARNMVQFLRLLVADGRGEPASRVGVDFEIARLDLEGGSRRELRAALLEIVRSHLAHATGCESFAWFGAPRAELQSSWALVLESRAEFAWMPALPGPGEAASAVAARALAALERADSEPGECALWRARLERAQAGVRAGEAAFRRGLGEGLAGPGFPAALAAAWIAGLCECLLDRGAVREARALLLEQRDRVASDARLCQLLCWCKLLLGDEAGARALQSGRRAPELLLPGPLHALRARIPAWLGLLPQRFVESARALPRTSEPSERSDIGASVCVVFELESSGELRASRIDVAPALRAGLEDWLAGQRFAPQESGSLQQRLVLEQRARVEHRAGEFALPGTLGSGQTLALALVPLVTTRGELAGWAHLEFEHHLVPREEILLTWARSLPARRAARAECEPASVRTRVREGEQTLFAGLAERLGLRGPQRRWWGFRVLEGRPLLAAEGGDSTAPASEAPGGQALLGRVLMAGGHLGFVEPDAALALRASSQSGLALALRFGGRVAGILVVESLRRGDLPWAGGQEKEAHLAQAAAWLRFDSFREVQRERHGADVWFDLESPDFLSFSARLFRAADSDCCVLFAGPPGVGKTVLARWLQHESARASSELLELRPPALASEAAWTAVLERARGATLLLESVERLEPAAQERLLHWLEARRDTRDPAERPRLLATTSVGDPRFGERLDAALARQLERIRFDVPALRARRFEIPALAQCLLARLAKEEGVPAPTLDDGALALLWRQDWDGNLGELESTLHRALLFAPNPVLGAGDFERMAARSGRKLVRRLPSRHPLRSDLASALRTTLLGTGRVNKTRAAAYLGWDPDTLVARLTDLRIDPSVCPPDSAWDAPQLFSARGEESAGAELEAPPAEA